MQFLTIQGMTEVSNNQCIYRVICIRGHSRMGKIQNGMGWNKGFQGRVCCEQSFKGNDPGSPGNK